MNSTNVFRLIALAAIWGGAFLFLRICAPVLGPAMLIELRLLLAALFLAVVALVLGKRLDVRRHWKHFTILGLFNSALPFLLFAYAARTLPASVMSVLNATAPLWGALIGVVWKRQPVSLATGAGLALGMAGVALLVGFDPAAALPGAGVAVVCVLVAPMSYSIASLYAKSAQHVDSFANAHGSMWSASILVLPALAFFPVPGTPTVGVMGAVVALGILCSGIAYLMYFRLIEEAGSTPALAVTFLIPVFGILWGALFLDEAIGWHTITGSAIVLVGTALVTGFMPRFGRSATAAAK